uniref:Uncharacterized protein n=1 Tax=Populus trichocarpa TaxID=3694 RepID=A0A2K1ZPF7_POPTR
MLELSFCKNLASYPFNLLIYIKFHYHAKSLVLFQFQSPTTFLSVFFWLILSFLCPPYFGYSILQIQLSQLLIK